MRFWASETGRIIKVETFKKDRGTYAKGSFKAQAMGVGGFWGSVRLEMK
jgi:hypothetical protein